MIQDDKNLSARDKKIIVNERVIGAIDQLVKKGLAKNALQIAEKTGYDYKNASRYKKGKGFVGTDDIFGLVNEFGLNPSYIFMKDGPEKESLVIEKSVHIAGNVGDNNTIVNEHNSNKPTINVHGTVGSLNVVHTLDKLMSDVPTEVRDQIRTAFAAMNDRLETIKKISDRNAEDLVDKKEQLIEMKRELVETKSQLKKKDVQLTEKTAELLQTKDELIRVQKKVNEVQAMFVEKKANEKNETKS